MGRWASPHAVQVGWSGCVCSPVGVSGAALMGEVHADRPTRTACAAAGPGLHRCPAAGVKIRMEEAKGLRTRAYGTKSGIERCTYENQGLRGRAIA